MSEQTADPIIFDAAPPVLIETAQELFAAAFNAHRVGDTAAAAPLYEQAIAKVPEHFEAINNLGVIRIQQRRMDEAIMLFQATLDTKPGYALAHSNMASVLTAMKRRKEALWHARQSNVESPSNPSALNNMSEALIQLGRFEDAEAVAQQALDTYPEMPEAMNNLGVAKWGQDETKAAKDLFARVVTLQAGTHNGARAMNNLGVMALRDGDYTKGWALYQARFDADKLTKRFVAHDEWDGEAHTCGKLIVVAEQGLGDEILYLSMAAETAARFKGPVVWECDVRLTRLAADISPNLTFVPRTLVIPHAYPGASHRIDAGTLGKFIRPAPDKFPAAAQPWLSPTQLTFAARPARVGISWRSVNTNNGANKSIPYEEWTGFIVALRQQGVEIVNLQYGDTPDADADPRIIKPAFDARFDIEALANEMAGCDMIVTVSNTTAHLAGALGLPTIVLLADGMGRYWYWGADVTTPWYPTARVVRQQGQPWADIFETIAAGMLDDLRKSS